MPIPARPPTPRDEMMLSDRVRRLRREGVLTDEGPPDDASASGADAGRATGGDPQLLAGGALAAEPGTAVEVVPDTPALVDVETGEQLAPTIENAARVLDLVSRARDRLSAVAAEAAEVVRLASREQGIKTFHVGDLDVVLSGGPGIDYDPLALREALRAAECPEERINRVVKEEITYKIDRSVLKQLTGANEDYKAAAELAERPVEKKWSASAKPRLR